MEHNHDHKGFQYTYSAKEQAELKRIRDKYTPSTEAEDKMDRLRRLDSGVTRKAQTAALTVGVVGVLILGLGMSFCMTDLMEALGLSHRLAMPVGIPVGLFGGLLTALAYPIYHAVIKRERRRAAPEILRLTEELMK